MSFKSWLGALMGAEGSWLGFCILILILIWSLLHDTLIIKISVLYLHCAGAKNIHVVEVLIWALVGAVGSWLGFGILILIWISSLIFDIPMIWILALYLDFEGAKNIHVLEVLVWGFGGCLRFLTGVWNFNLDLDRVIVHWYIHIPNFDSFSWFIWCKEHPYPLIPHLGLWRTLEIPDWGLAS